MNPSVFGSKQDEYNFFSNAFKLIDEQRTDSFMNSLRALFFELFFNGRSSQCFPAYHKLASQASDRLRIENWNEIPLWRIRRKGFAGYQEALQEIFRRLCKIYKESLSEKTRGQVIIIFVGNRSRVHCEGDETLRRVEQLMKLAVGVLSRRISEVGQCGLLDNAKGMGNHLNVIEFWTRCLKKSTQEISEIKVSLLRRQTEEDGMSFCELLAFCFLCLFVVGMIALGGKIEMK